MCFEEEHSEECVRALKRSMKKSVNKGQAATQHSCTHVSCTYAVFVKQTRQALGNEWQHLPGQVPT